MVSGYNPAVDLRSSSKANPIMDLIRLKLEAISPYIDGFQKTEIRGSSVVLVIATPGKEKHEVCTLIDSRRALVSLNHAGKAIAVYPAGKTETQYADDIILASVQISPIMANAIHKIVLMHGVRRQETRVSEHGEPSFEHN